MVIAGRRAYRAKEAMVVRRRVPNGDHVAIATRHSVD
jgi:hypothetical protein